MENNEPITYEQKKAMHSFFFESEEGKLFVKTLKDMQTHCLDQAMYTVQNEIVAANVHQAGGIKAVIDFIDTIHNEVEAHKKGEQKQSEWENSNSNRQASLSYQMNKTQVKAQFY